MHVHCTIVLYYLQMVHASVTPLQMLNVAYRCSDQNMYHVHYVQYAPTINTWCMFLKNELSTVNITNNGTVHVL